VLRLEASITVWDGLERRTRRHDFLSFQGDNPNRHAKKKLEIVSKGKGARSKSLTLPTEKGFFTETP
jgi:hypothetical protein